MMFPATTCHEVRLSGADGTGYPDFSQMIIGGVREKLRDGNAIVEGRGIRCDPTRGERGSESRATLSPVSMAVSVPVMARTQSAKNHNRAVNEVIVN
jgi:hypothetical protein